MKTKLSVLLAAIVAAMAFSTTSASGAQYVALGDSYSSGNGTGYFNLNPFCGRSTLAYPYLISRQRSDISLRFVACGGATTSNVLNSQISSLTSTTNYVTITIGGNDVGFAEGLFSCPNDGDNPECYTAIANANTKIDTILPGALDKTYAAIKQRSPNAKVVVLGYGLYATKLCAGTGGVTQNEMNALLPMADKLDNKIAERVALAGANFTFLSAINPFLPHEICSTTPWIRGDTNNLLNDFHPNAAGHRDGYAPMVRSVIG